MEGVYTVHLDVERNPRVPSERLEFAHARATRWSVDGGRHDRPLQAEVSSEARTRKILWHAFVGCTVIVFCGG